MRKRKLQIFLSSTYEDLIDERLAAIEAILAAGHIPAAMEQFSPGDETAWERIRAWIDESDGFILILGGRYGSIEPTSGKSYVQLEYEYVLEKKRPFFALVVSGNHHEDRVRNFGLKVDEREHPQEYRELRSIVTQRLCGFWNDRRDIKAAIFQKLPEWAQRSDLTGWVRADEATSPEALNELARLSGENRELRAQVKSNSESFDGLEFGEFIQLLAERKLSQDEHKSASDVIGYDAADFLQLFELAFDVMAAGSKLAPVTNASAFDALVGFGLLSKEFESTNFRTYYITDGARHLRNRLLTPKRSIDGPGIGP
jgi:hypothetical protein